MLKQYVTIGDYTEYAGAMSENVSNPRLNNQLKFASLKIDELTFNRIVDFEKLTPFQKERVQLAVCLQTDYQHENGNADNSENNLSSYSSLDISVSFNTSQGDIKTSLRESGISLEAYNILMQTGLMNRGI